MPDLIIHGGAPKTGTSFLQVLFARYADRLSANGVVYPPGHLFDEAKEGQITSGNGVEMANYLRPLLPHEISDKDAFIVGFEETLASTAGKNVLYSSEFLIAPVGERSNAVLEIAKRYDYRIRYIYFVRDIAAAFLATYSQMVKRSGEARPMTECLREWDPGYSDALQHACAVFGRNNVEVYNYDERRESLAAFFFKEVLQVGFAPEESPIVNRSLTAKELEWQRLVNSVHPGDMKISTFVSDALISIKKGDDDKPAVTEEEAALMSDRFSAVVDYVNTLVRGRPTAMADCALKRRDEVTLSSLERSLAAVVARVAGALNR